MTYLKVFIVLVLSGGLLAMTPAPTYQVAVVQYSGGGDWYSNPTSMPNLVRFCNQKLHTNIDSEVPYVEVGSADLFNYPLVHLTGHGNVVFNNAEVDNLRTYLVGGGFLHIDDNYGLDAYIRPQMKKVFPNSEFIEVPFDHPIYHQAYDFNSGLPKVHEHDGQAPQGFGIFHEGRMVCFYTYEADLGDGWEDYEVHKDSEATREKALQMGANIVQFALMGNPEE